MKPIAIITTWFGADLTGGAEQQTLQIATRLAAREHTVVVLTTCNRSFHDDWSVNHYPPGASHEHGLTIRRFTVDARDASAFDRVNAKLLTLDRSALRPGVNPVSAGEARTFVLENIKSAALLGHLREQRESYHAFLFLPYMFGPSVLGVPVVSDRAWLQPCLHDEPAAYLPQIAAMFRCARALLFNSAGELDLALRLYGPGIYNRSDVVGEGIERSRYERDRLEAGLPAELRGKRFVLYLGRRDRTKNTDLLARAFAQFKAAKPKSDLQLVLAGPGSVSFASTDGVSDLGLVSNETKAALLTHCRALAQPSHHESFSRTMMEAWTLGRPVLAQRDCLATAGAVKDAGGGWLAATESEWAQLFAQIADASDEELARRGALGRAYADENADWGKVITRYEMLLDLIPPAKQSEAESRLLEDRPSQPRRVSPTSEPQAIHQLLPDIVFGDAISNQARAIRNHLRRHGYESEIFVKRRETRMGAEAVLWDEAQPSPADGLIYHHSIGSELTAFAVAHRGPKCLVYHNITPAKFFTQYRPGFAWMLETGRAHLPRLAQYFTISAGDSAYNAAELTACGFRTPGVLPIIVDPHKWDIAPDDKLMAGLQDGRTNLLFVGRIAPNKQQERLIEAFGHYCRFDPNSRLIIVGEGGGSDPYFGQVRATTERLHLSSQVEITGQVDEAALLAYYRTAHLYWSASAHEGFGAPLIEAMWFDVPVLALRASAVPETLGAAGVLFDGDEEPAVVAARAHQLTQDTDLRESVIAAQRRRRVDFTSAAVESSLVRLIEQLTTAPELTASPHA
jgi:glycosyltransferase involved in cell wall biosynthesis